MDQFNDQSLPGRLRPPQPTRLSEVLAALAREAQGPVSVGAIRASLGDRSFAALLVFFAAINMLPLPPGTTAVLGLPLVIVSSQMVFGAKTAWLPAIVLRKSFSADQFRAVAGRVVPWLQWIERWISPRYWPFWPGQGERLVGALALVMGVAVTLPIPLGNWFPAFASALLGLALSERDGVLFAVAVAASALALAIVVAVIGSAGAVLNYLWMLTPFHG